MANFLSAEDSTFEGGTIGGWVPGPSGGARIALSSATDEAHGGTHSLLVETVPSGSTAATWQFQSQLILLPPWVSPPTYTVAVWRYVPEGTTPRQLMANVTYYYAGGGVAWGESIFFGTQWDPVPGVWTLGKDEVNQRPSLATHARLTFSWSETFAPPFAIGEKRYFDDFYFSDIPLPDVVATVTVNPLRQRQNTVVQPPPLRQRQNPFPVS